MIGRQTRWLLTAMLFSTLLKGQSQEKALAEFRNKGVEKIYLQYDKEYYVSGETIWFKAYLYSNGKPSGQSDNFFLQFTNSRGELIADQKYPVAGATASGHIQIPDSLPQGNYYIRAFTPRMLNEDEAFNYHKNIFVFKQTGSGGVQSVGKTITVNFFPESGHLVDGILTTVAFKATDQWGQPAEVSGTIKNDEGTTIAPFKTLHDGIGKLQIKPVAGRKYIAEVETDAGKRSYNLPEVDAEGINLKLTDEPGGKKFQLSRAVKNKQHYDVLRLVVTENYGIIYDNEIAFEDYPSVIGHLLTDSLPSGILHFTVFDKENKPLAERLTFVDNGEYRSKGEIVIAKKGIAKREENSLEITFTEAVQRSLSVSVVDLASANDGDAESIWSNFLLSSDLRGYIYNPAWYFSEKNDTVKQALDNLMLTHGWSRYTWAQLSEGQKSQQAYADPAFIIIKGLVTDANNKPVNGGKLNLFLDAADVSSQHYITDVDANGRFMLDSMVFRGKGEFFYAYTDKKEKPVPAVVVIDTDPFAAVAKKTSLSLINESGKKNDILPGSKEELNARMKYVKDLSGENVKELAGVEVKNEVNSTKAADAVNDKYTTGAFRSPGKETIDNINNPPTDMAQNGVDFVKNRIQQIVLDGNRFTNRKNFSLISGQRWTVGLFINEQPAELLQLRMLRADEIALVKFYEAGFVGTSSTTPGGAVAVYTKEKKMEPAKDDKLEVFTYPGYTVIKEFFNPDYSAPPKKQVEDNRTTLFWAPVLFTDATTTTVPVHFYNNDTGKKYKVVIEGFDVNGKLVHLERIVE